MCFTSQVFPLNLTWKMPGQKKTNGCSSHNSSTPYDKLGMGLGLDFWTYRLGLSNGYFFKFRALGYLDLRLYLILAYQSNPGIRSKTDFWLVWRRRKVLWYWNWYKIDTNEYHFGSLIPTRLVCIQGWYCLRSHQNVIGSLLLILIPVLIPGMGDQT
jgi:hypothetical protein